MFKTLNQIHYSNLIQLQFELLLTLNLISSPFHNNFNKDRQCQEDPRGPTRANSTTSGRHTPSLVIQIHMSEEAKADGGLHMGSSFGSTTYQGITTYQWASLCFLVAIIVWLNLRYRKKSAIASDAKKGILPYGRSNCLLYTSPSPRDKRQSRMPSSA